MTWHPTCFEIKQSVFNDYVMMILDSLQLCGMFTIFI
jgi:hypothetical protein